MPHASATDYDTYMTQQTALINKEQATIKKSQARIKHIMANMKQRRMEHINNQGGFTITEAIIAYGPTGHNEEGRQWLEQYLKSKPNNNIHIDGYNPRTNQWGLRLHPREWNSPHIADNIASNIAVIQEFIPYIHNITIPNYQYDNPPIHWTHKGQTYTAEAIIHVSGTDLCEHHNWLLVHDKTHQTWAIIDARGYAPKNIYDTLKAGTLEDCLEIVYRSKYFMDDDESNDD